MNIEPIDTSTTAGKAEVMRLASEGRKVARRGDYAGSSWEECVSPLWDWNYTQYAIIAEPVGPEEMWVVITDCGVVVAASCEQHARRIARENESVVKYRRAE